MKHFTHWVFSSLRLFHLFPIAALAFTSCDCSKPGTPLDPDAGEPATLDSGMPVVDSPDSGIVAAASSRDDVSFADRVTFLYSEPNARQVGVVAGAIELKRVAVLRGQVFDVAMKPLAGVKVFAQGKKAYGHTLSQSDG